MSTRCQIGFYEEDEKDLEKFRALIYRHSDGYPDGEHGVVASILPFLNWWSNTRGVGDTEYVSARMLQYLCNRYDNPEYKGAEKVMIANLAGQLGRAGFHTNTALVGQLGHGISKSFHGDIEYLYVVRPSKLEVYEIPFERDGNGVSKANLIQTHEYSLKSPYQVEQVKI